MRTPWVAGGRAVVLIVVLLGHGAAWGEEARKERAPAAAAIADFSEIQDLAQTDPVFAMQVYQLAGQRYLSRNEAARAVAMYTRALTLNPSEVSVMEELADAQVAADEPKAALATWERLMQVRGDDVGTRMRYANFLDRVGEQEKAIGAMRALAAQQPNDTTFRYWIADAYFRNGKMAEAATELHAMLGAFPKEESEIRRRLALVQPAPAQAMKPTTEVSGMLMPRKPGKSVGKP